MSNKINKKLNNSNTKNQPKKFTGIWVDIIGVILILSTPMLYYMCIKGDNSGEIGWALGGCLNFLFGTGKFIFPIFILYLGFFIIFKNNEIFNKPVNTYNFFKTKSLIGALCLFLSIDALFGTADLNNLTQEDWTNNFFPNSGGYIGYYISLVLSKLFGDLLFYFLGVIIIISIILIVNFNYKAFKENREKLSPPLISPNPVGEEPLTPKENSRLQFNKKGLNEQDLSENKDDKGLLAKLLEDSGNKPKPTEAKTTKENQGEFSFSRLKKNVDFKLPPTSLLNPPQPKKELDNNENIKNIKTIENTLSTFNIQAEVLNVSDGPTVSRYEVKLAEGIKVQKIVQLADNLAMSLAAIDVRIEAPIPGKSAIGIEVPKLSPSMVTLREIIEDPAFQKAKGILTFAIGKDVAAKAIFADLTKMPHLLIAGATNSGKSVGLNTLIASLLYRMTPDELRFVMIDPKRVELSLYDGIPHLACPVIKDARLAAGALKAIVDEMDRRNKLLEESTSRNIESYNSKVDPEEKLPYMVIVIDELADLMMQCAKDVEASICRIAQLARAVGIHLVIATQRPSVNVVTGLIKANIPSRISFAVSSHTDSRVILDQSGAERLIGRGDMLFAPIDANKPLRVQGCYLSEKEIENLVLYLKEQKEPNYTIKPIEVPSGDGDGSTISGTDSDDLWEDVVKYVIHNSYCSTSMIQRKFKIGYNRAGKLVDMLEEAGIVGPLNGAKARDVLLSEADIDRILNNEK